MWGVVVCGSSFGEEGLEKALQGWESKGRALREKSEFQTADDLFRRAHVFADRIYGTDDPRARDLLELRNTNLDDAMRARLRFREGHRVHIVSGEHKGAKGIDRKSVV